MSKYNWKVGLSACSWDSALGVPLWKILPFFFPIIITVEGVNRVTDVNLLSPMQV